MSEGTELNFPGMRIRIGRVMGMGANAVAYEGSYPDAQLMGRRHRVLVKELFPYSPEGEIRREENGSIVREQSEQDRWELHRESFLRGACAHIRLLEELPERTEGNLNTFSLNNTLYSVLSYSGGRTLEQEEENIGIRGLTSAILLRRMLQMADALEDLHQSGFLHLDISPDNMLLLGDGKKERLTLIDYNSVHTLDEIRRGDDIYFSVKDGFTAPEVLHRRVRDMGEASDLYSLCSVFCYMLTGEKLTPCERSHGTVPSLSRMPAFSDMAGTVKSKLISILRRGIAPSVSRRYHHVQELRGDLEELQERMEGKGISTAALWETGRTRVLRILRHNPALSFVERKDKIYPVRLGGEDGRNCFLAELAEDISSSSGGAVLLTGDGGAGKTTALLRMVLESAERYSDAEAVFAYIPLYGWKEGNGSFIRDTLLSDLSFSPETDGWAGARHELESLIRRPIHGSAGERPRLILLLDGYNEANGDKQALVEEMRYLDAMAGVRLIIAGRTGPEGMAVTHYQMKPLEPETVRQLMRSENVPESESPEVMELLRSPMMLSMYMTLGKDSQLRVKGSGDLLSAYLNALADKEIQRVGEGSEESFRIQAAVFFLLPAIAAFMRRQNRPLTDKELLPVVKQNYRRIRKRGFTGSVSSFNWIGHRRDILGGAEDYEEWYNLMVRQLLWKRLGLLIVDEEGRYRIFHGRAGEYLSELSEPVERRYRRRKLCGITLIAAAVCALGFFVFSQLREQSYDEGKAENVLSAAEMLYFSSADQYETLLKLLDEDNGREEDFEPFYMPSDPERALEVMMESGSKMPWSGTRLDQDEGEAFLEAYSQLVSMPEERQERYGILLSGLRLCKEDGTAFSRETVLAYLEADAKVLSLCYHLTLTPELKSMGYDQQAGILSTSFFYENQNRILLEMEDPDYGKITELRHADLGNIRIADHRAMARHL